MRIDYQKLVRDGIPELIESRGDAVIVRILDDAEYRSALISKLMEEAREAQEASGDSLLGELADIIEVITAILPAVGSTWDELNRLAAAKRARVGGFEKRLFLEFVEEVS